MFGDPHIRTLDGYVYTFNGIGEYTMVTMFDGSFTLQARTSQITDVTGTPVLASKWSAFSARVREGVTSQVQIEMNSDETGACDVNTNYIKKQSHTLNLMLTQLC